MAAAESRQVGSIQPYTIAPYANSATFRTTKYNAAVLFVDTAKL